MTTINGAMWTGHVKCISPAAVLHPDHCPAQMDGSYLWRFVSTQNVVAINCSYWLSEWWWLCLFLPIRIFADEKKAFTSHWRTKFNHIWQEQTKGLSDMTMFFFLLLVIVFNKHKLTALSGNAKIWSMFVWVTINEEVILQTSSSAVLNLVTLFSHFSLEAPTRQSSAFRDHFCQLVYYSATTVSVGSFSSSPLWTSWYWWLIHYV